MKPLPLSKLHYFFCRNHADFLSEGWVKEVFFFRALQLELSFRPGSGGVSSLLWGPAKQIPHQ